MSPAVTSLIAWPPLGAFAEWAINTVRQPEKKALGRAGSVGVFDDDGSGPLGWPPLGRACLREKPDHDANPARRLQGPGRVSVGEHDDHARPRAEPGRRLDPGAHVGAAAARELNLGG